MRLHLRDIKAFSDCPAYYHFSRGGQVLVPQRRAVTESVIKKCYIQATETGYRTSWRSVVGWVDAEVFRDVNIEEDEKFRAAKVLSEHILSSVQKWYDKQYLIEEFDSYADLEISQYNIGSATILGTAPIIHATEPVILTVFADLGITRIELYNDLRIRGLAWLLSDTLEGSDVQVRTLAIGPRGGLETIEFPVSRLDHERVRDVVQQVARSIRANFRYPSRTEQCRSCEYVRRCKL